MIWTVLSPKTLASVKEELLQFVQDTAKDMSHQDTRKHLTTLLMVLNEIDDALEVLGVDKWKTK